MSHVPLASKVVVYLCGFVFAAGWWTVIAGYYGSSVSFLGALCPLLTSVALLALTRLPSKAIVPSDNEWGEDSSSQRIAILVLIATLLGGVGCSWGLWGLYHREEAETVAVLLPPIGTTMLAIRYVQHYQSARPHPPCLTPDWSMEVSKPLEVTHASVGAGGRKSGQASSIFSLSLSSTGRLATSGLDCTVRIWSSELQLLSILSRHTGAVLCARWSPNGELLATASDDSIVNSYGSFEAECKEHYTVVHRLTGHESDVNGVEWSSDGRYLASCGLDGRVLVWDVQNSFNLLRRIETEPRRPLKGLVWDPLGQFLATQSNDGTLYVWRLQDWKLETLISSPYTEGPVESLTYFSRPAWSPDGRVLCLPDALNESDTVALLVERDDWRCEQSLVGHAGAVQTARFSPRLYRTTEDNQLVVALGAQDGVVSLWGSGGERPLAVLTGLFDHAVMDLAWNADGRCLYAASYDGTVAMIKMETSVVGTVVDVQEQDELLGKLCQVQKSAVLALPTSLAQIALQDRLDSIMTQRKPLNPDSTANLDGTASTGNLATPGNTANLSNTMNLANCSNSSALQAGLVTAPASTDAITSVPALATPQRESRLKNGKRRITPQLLQSANPTPSTESYTVVVGKAARKSWLRVATPKTLVVGSIEVTNNTGSGNNCRIVRLQDGRVLWEERYDSLVTAAVVTGTDVLIAALNTNRIVVLSPAGRRLLPPLLLSAPVTRLLSCEDVCTALLDNGLFYVWYGPQYELPPQGLSSELVSLELRCRDNEITLDFGFPSNRLVYSASQRVFFECDGTDLPDTLIDAIWGDPAVDPALIARLLNQVDSADLKAKSLAQMEAQIAACRMVGDFDRLVAWLAAYVQRLALEERVGKLQELLEDLPTLGVNTSNVRQMISSFLATSPSALLRHLADNTITSTASHNSNII
ncbi:hypothetical protein PSACC_03234 [Paramicrosporidium saccamoebae]|uniref:Protein HIR n=1 Tax=Paramicrosporidium saccamoebae TaxID=1246581 RepID=A0A2H9TGW1_9FUNG|nr:hypothetical protein PSACC_03234 [Paramicrosporidium saccamoebae]